MYIGFQVHRSGKPARVLGSRERGTPMRFCVPDSWERGNHMRSPFSRMENPHKIPRSTFSGTGNSLAFPFPGTEPGTDTPALHCLYSGFLVWLFDHYHEFVSPWYCTGPIYCLKSTVPGNCSSFLVRRDPTKSSHGSELVETMQPFIGKRTPVFSFTK